MTSPSKENAVQFGLREEEKEMSDTLPGEFRLTREFILSSECSKVIDSVLRHFPQHLKEDLKQAAYLSIFESLNKNPAIRISPSAYIRPIVNARALAELAELYPIYSINHSILCNLLRNRKGKKSYGSQDTLKRLDKTRCIYFSDIEEALENE